MVPEQLRNNLRLATTIAEALPVVAYSMTVGTGAIPIVHAYCTFEEAKLVLDRINESAYTRLYIAGTSLALTATHLGVEVNCWVKDTTLAEIQSLWPDIAILVGSYS